MAARLEEREGHPERALNLLQEGLDASQADPELHFRTALLMAQLQPDRDVDIRRHFRAALLGPRRNVLPRLAYGAYLFSQRDFGSANEQFAQSDDLVVANPERFEVRKFRFGRLGERHQGQIWHLTYGYGFVEFAQGAIDIFFSLRQVPQHVIDDLDIGQLISYETGFNFKGPIAVELRLTE